MKMKKFIVRHQKTWKIIGSTDCQHKAYRMAAKQGNGLGQRAVIQNVSELESFPEHYFMVMKSGRIVRGTL